MNPKQLIITALFTATIIHSADDLKLSTQGIVSVANDHALPEEVGFAHNKGWCIVQAPPEINVEEDYPITVVYSELERLNSSEFALPLADALAQKNRRETFSIEEFNKALYDVVKTYDIYPPVDAAGNRMYDLAFTPLSVAWILVSKAGIQYYRSGRVLIDPKTDTIRSYEREIEALDFSTLTNRAAPTMGIFITDHFLNISPQSSYNSAQFEAEKFFKRMGGDVAFYLVLNVKKWLAAKESSSTTNTTASARDSSDLPPECRQQ